MRKTQEELAAEIGRAVREVNIGGLYYHYKKPEQSYAVEFVGCLESTEEVCVGYRALYGKGILWVRKMNDFLEEVEVGGKKVKRFTLCE